jgi:replication factor C subunit 1
MWLMMADYASDRYNAVEHPIPFHKATDLSKIKKLASQNAPDLEDAYEVDEEIPPSDEEQDVEDDDISKDKLFKTKKGKAAAGEDGKGKSKAKGGRKSKVD